jgi:RNA polymerase sigma-70 factor (ECF subfamily)
VRIGDKTEAEDIAVEVFLKALQSLKSYEERASYAAWLFRIAHNMVVDHLGVRQVNSARYLLMK